MVDGDGAGTARVQGSSGGGAAATVDPRARSLVRRVVRPTLSAWLRLDVEGEHHIPRTGPVVIASTHASHADSMALGACLERPVYFLGDERLTRWPVLGPWLPRIGMVPVARGSGDLAALGLLEDLLEQGEAVVVYPEGSRTRDGRVYRPRSGTARLAAETQVPVVPAAVVGTFEVWPTQQKPRWLGAWGATPVRLRFGPAMDPPQPSPKSRRAFNDQLHDVLVALSGKPRADEFAPLGDGVTV